MATYKWGQAKNLPWYFDRKKFQHLSWVTLPDHRDESKITNNFVMGDTYELYKKNKAILGPDWHYWNKTLTYTCNSQGYRAPEFDTVDWKNSIVVFGCSMVAGIGVDDKETITHQLHLKSGRPVINMGAPGAGLDVALWNNYILRSQYAKPWAVVNLFTNFHRFCIYREQDVSYIGPWDDKNPAYTSYMQHPNHSIIKAMQQTDQIKHMWKDTRTFYGSFFDESAHHASTDHRLLFHNTARDLQHCGPKDNKRNAALIWSYLQSPT
jgi:hypothetical protein